MDEDWDNPTESSEEPGKTFGSRGRGFLPPSSESRVGRSPQKYEYNKNESDDICWDNGKNEKEDDWGYGHKSDDKKRDEDDNGWDGYQEKKHSFKKDSRNGGFRGERDAEQKPKPSIYIPKDPTENEEEIFGSGISSGINFDKYDDIEVHVSGENPPRPIRNFEESGVRYILLDLIKKCRYTKPTPIQKYSIPIIMSGRDMMACAQTGSGKTAAFLIPMMNKLLEEVSSQDLQNVCRPHALVIAPTRELTIQIFNEARKFSRGSALKIELAYGGTSVRHQIEHLTIKGCDFLVATPGRLLDILRRGKLDFSRLKFIVLDEADRMLDLGFLNDVQEVMNQAKSQGSADRQTLMFSATFPEEIQRLAEKFLNNYLFVAVGIVGGACSDVEQKFYAVSKFEKRTKLLDLLSDLKDSKCLVFVERKRTTDFIAALLSEKGFLATSIHGDREQREREEALNDFKAGRMNILVATSVAARGLDIKNVAHVVNYDLPKSIDDYVHRIGRTGRVGNRGSAINFYDESQDHALAPDLVKILKQAKQKVPDFLLNVEGGTGGYDYSSKFGGKDFRNIDCDEDAASPYTFETETW